MDLYHASLTNARFCCSKIPLFGSLSPKLSVTWTHINFVRLQILRLQNIVLIIASKKISFSKNNLHYQDAQYIFIVKTGNLWLLTKSMRQLVIIMGCLLILLFLTIVIIFLSFEKK